MTERFKSRTLLYRFQIANILIVNPCTRIGFLYNVEYLSDENEESWWKRPDERNNKIAVVL